MNRFTGFFTALPTPFDTEGRLIDNSVRGLVRHNAALGMDGVFVGGSTGEAFLQENAERKRMLDLVAEEAPEDFTLMAHVACLSTASAVDLARHAEAAGYHAISSVQPFYYGYTFKELYGYFSALADATALPVFVYNIPAFSGLTFNDAQLESILSIPNVVGIKFTSRDLFQMERIKTAHPDTCVLYGYDEMILGALSLGADGGVGSTYNVLGAGIKRLAGHFQAGRMAEALAEQREINEVIAALVRVGVIQGLKVLLDTAGVDVGVCRAPFEMPGEEEKEALRAVAARYLALPVT